MVILTSGMGKCMCVVLWFMLHIIPSLCFTVVIPRVAEIGSEVFNVSHGPGWSYSVDLYSTSARALGFVTLDSSTGVLYLNKHVSCEEDSPSLYRVLARKNTHETRGQVPANHTVTTLLLQGEHCLTPIDHRKQKRTYQRQTYFIVVYGNFLNENGCIQPDQNILDINNHIPVSFRSCNNFVNSIDTQSLIHDRKTASIITDRQVCLHSHNWSFNFNLIMYCKDMETDMKVNVVIHNLRNVQINPTMYEIKSQGSRHIRLKRATTINNPPAFAQDMYTKSVLEEQNPGLHVITITATDDDTGNDGTLTYSLEATSDQRSKEMFAIHPIMGRVNTTKRLDREEIRVHYLQVIATDNGSPSRNAQTFLTVQVTDVNDHAPVFEKSVFYQDVKESIGVSTTIMSVRATDKDSGDNQEIRYRIINPSGPASQTFMIDPISGSITTKTLLDRESKASYQLLVQAMDQGETSLRKSSTATININIQDVNDNSPQFSQKLYTVNIPEGHDYTSSPVIAYVSATDTDQGDNRIISYSIFGGNTDNTFKIDRSTGELSIQAALDREKVSEYSLLIRAQDGGSPMRSNTTVVRVTVLDVNDNDPYFYAPPYQHSVKEDVAVNTTVLSVQATDKDDGLNGELVYSLLLTPVDFPFKIEENTGDIKVKLPLDREAGDMYKFVVKVQDKGTEVRSATTDVTITISDVNDNHPIFPHSVYNKTVREDEEPGAKVILSLTAMDADSGDNALVDYSIISGNQDDAFRINTLNGEGLIKVNKHLNYKQVSRYVLGVRATDKGGKYDEAEVHILILDTNRHTPVFQGTPYTINVEENIAIDTSVYQVVALDDDIGENARLTYELHGSTSFYIDSTSGEIFTRVVLDREKKTGEAFYVTAQDHGVPSKTATTDVTVIINDMNDNSPEFSQKAYEGSVVENAQDGFRVLQITATDRDEQDNAFVQYTFQGGNDGDGDFEIDSASGAIRVAQPLDRETTSLYVLKAYAVDKGVPARSTSTIITIRVEDINDNRPIFPSSTIEIKVMENIPMESIIAQVSAVDPDEGVNAEVEYEKVGGGDADFFKLEYRPGGPAILRNLIYLDYEETKKVYQVLIRAKSDPFFSEALVLIMVQDVNDNEPILKDFTIIFNNFDDNFITGVIGRVPATDPDEIDRAKLVYEFVAGNDAEFLHLNQSTGQLTLDYRLNSDVPRNGTFQVKVSDGRNEVKATCQLYVRLVRAEMLQNSVTIRLNNMTQTAFLSPLYKFFVDALATIMLTEEKHVFVLNIQNDTDVNTQILNISVSVRKPDGMFHPAEYLKEQIYLQRILLANLSTLQVLPFDDNLCVIEPCPNFEICLSHVSFDEAAPFITSDMMLFRPIRPYNGNTCKCPKGFTGMRNDFLCDTEVNLCYSNPCLNGGTCVRREGGYSCRCGDSFTGTNCNINMTKKYDAATCPQDLCQPPSTCVPLIKGGFRCEGCPSEPHFNSFCQLTTRRFPKGSFLTFPSLKQRNRFTIQLKFATQQQNGLLFYNGRFNENHDFIALELIDGQVQFSFSLGSNITTISSNVLGGLGNGEWQQVEIRYVNKTVTLTVGEDCDTQIFVMYGDQITNNSCASRTTHFLPDMCAINTNICYRLLDLTGPFQIGGLPRLPSTFQIQNKDFEGCMKDIYIDNELLDLNKSVSNVGTQKGCLEKKNFCAEAPCRMGGTCVNGWGVYRCECPNKAGNKDCSQVIDGPKRLDGTGFLRYTNNSLSSVEIFMTWYNGLSFRTRAQSGALMYIRLVNSHSILMQLVDGYVHYSYRNDDGIQNYPFSAVKVNDGQWHYFEVRWQDRGQLLFLLDYGHWQKVDTVIGNLQNQRIEQIYVGAERIGTGAISKGFVGCVEDMRVGNTPSAILIRPQSHNVDEGCTIANPCDNNPCHAGATCVDQWADHSCICPPGTLGPNCEDICQTYNPCENWGNCRGPTFGQNINYTCDCGLMTNGDHCEIVAEQPCPASWYGHPICGPCNCSRKLGFNPACNKSTGECSCRENHYRPAGSDSCKSCDCYHYGSKNQSCHPVTGQCFCIDTVIGQQCKQCDSEFAEINLLRGGCTVNYYMCPRTYDEGVWWDGVLFGNRTVQDCPDKAIGDAKRNCTKDGKWLAPDLFNCTQPDFVSLQTQINKIESGELKITTFVAKKIMRKLCDAVMKATRLFGNDIYITYRILNQTLAYEVQQTGLSLTSEQDSTYLQSMLDILSTVMEPRYNNDWLVINKNSGGIAELQWKLEKYLAILSENLATLQSKPYSVVSENIVLVMDNLSAENFSGQRIPKFNNIVKKDTFDDDTYIMLSQSVVSTPLPSDPLAPVFEAISSSTAYVGFIMYKNLGDILPKIFDSNVRQIEERPLDVNAPVITLLVRDQGELVTGALAEPIKMVFKQDMTVNRSSPQCVYWKHSPNSYVGEWSTSGCEITDRYEREILEGSDPAVLQKFIECSCDHMTSFGVLMDVADSEYVAKGAISLEVVSFIAIGITLICLFVAFFIFMCFKHLQSNANSILINLVFTIFISDLAFISGVYRTEPELFCRLVSISLHYFYLAAFSWLFVEMLHLYRRLTEIRDINYGSMKFYYLIGYVIPGIIVGLSVGLYTDGYGGSQFCWLDMAQSFIWSFAGPVVFGVLVIILTFILALKASFREKIHVNDIVGFRARIFCGLAILLLLGVTWILGLVSVNYNLVPLHYAYAIFSLAEGGFIFVAYIVGDKKVRLQLKKQWYKCQGKKLEMAENLGGTRSSRSALAYRTDNSMDGCINRTMNVGISTTSTTSRSTSKSSGGLYKGEDYLRSTSTSTSGHVPSESLYPPNAGIPPYGYDLKAYHEKRPNGTTDHMDGPNKRSGNDSDSDSDGSVGRASLSLASSHSSDDEDDVAFTWEKEMPLNQKVEEAKEQARKKKKENDDAEKQKNNANTVNPPPLYSQIQQQQNQYGHWPGDPNLSGFQFTESEDYRQSDQVTMSSVPPDVTLPAQELQASHRDYIMPPVRTDSLLNDSSSSNTHGPFHPPPDPRVKVQVLTHNGSISSDSECSHETSV
ncbi:cadherin EGF LAG seven-pass G-type receptor 2-like isoform X2 [Mizuhopecten yessoensis]|uniref:cadherin EGF LAG seven-pass G-type receptor 2-like isoform X1 n=1 Tax=Mizuhopecten yessoensis TaxID=6573 RepID=UPI000B45E3B2|nr:cadherin EGF LAG seven-pass G-type receptor 2-like isoform X1 [Mizuhopecten yessoensis]XP_021344025.1 cadherin EGF LAG seven-pass G-type receptor 2-like isoform X2 [Mizuhopecten yessoensis]